MSIDARISMVTFQQKGAGRLVLVDRPGNPPGIAGQTNLRFTSNISKDILTRLIGCDIWGGDKDIMLGRETKIADRHGYVYIQFCVDEAGLLKAIEDSGSGV